MVLTPIFDPDRSGRPLRAAAFMSGSGTNVVKLVEAADQSAFEIAFIFSDRSDGAGRGEAIALEHGLPYFSYDIRRFHQLRGVKRTVATAEGLAARKEYDRLAARLIKAFEVDVIALGGYMSFTTLDRCVNVHPADLSLVDETGRRRFVGDDAVYDAIAAGQAELRSSTIWTDQGVDSGPLLMISRPVAVNLPAPLDELKADPDRLRRLADRRQEELKEMGDWEIFPQTMDLIAKGRFAFDEKGRLYVDGQPAPTGLRLD